MKTIIVAACAALALAGCASVTRGTTENISISSTPSGAEATVSGLDVPTACLTPCVVTVKRSADISVAFAKAGYEPQIIPLPRKFREAARPASPEIFCWVASSGWAWTPSPAQRSITSQIRSSSPYSRWDHRHRFRAPCGRGPSRGRRPFRRRERRAVVARAPCPLGRQIYAACSMLMTIRLPSARKASTIAGSLVGCFGSRMRRTSFSSLPMRRPSSLCRCRRRRMPPTARAPDSAALPRSLSTQVYRVFCPRSKGFGQKDRRHVLICCAAKSNHFDFWAEQI